VSTTAEWLDALSTGRALPKDNVLLSNQRARTR
jgi:hypothetical protein